MSDVVHHQFCRITGYGIQSRSKREPWACIRGIAAEAERIPGACRHVAEVRPPIILHGISPVEVGQIAEERANVALDSRGRRLRRDGVVLLAAVLSYPVPREKVELPNAKEERERYEDWRAKALAWLIGRFGTSLLSVVEHSDEAFLHLHGLIVPDLGPGDRLQLAAVHPGRAALANVQSAGGTKGEQRTAYIEAMRELQVHYHEAVGKAFKHHPFGPKRQRRERPVHIMVRDAEARRAELEEEFAKRRRDLEAEYEQTLQAARAELAEDMHKRFGANYSDAVRAAKLLDARRRSDHERINNLIGEIAALHDRLSVYEPKAKL